MQFPYQREFAHAHEYRGRLSCIIFDWAGTTIDFGCIAPTIAFCQAFAQVGVPIRIEESRLPMGVHKKTHINLICQIPRVRQCWTQTHGTEPTAEDVQRIFKHFIPLQEACLTEYSQLIPGTREVVAECRRRGYAIGSTSGYLPSMLKIVQDDAEKQGYLPDFMVGAGDVKHGRPHPSMVLHNMLALDIAAVQSVVKIDDTLSGIEEGLNAGCWTIGVAVSGNEVGATLAQWCAFPEAVKQDHRARVYSAMYQHGAHYVIDSIADLLPCLDHIELRLQRGEKP